MTLEEKKAWAEDLLRRKHAQLGKIPTKKRLRSRYLRPDQSLPGSLGPRALESAGLKQPREKKVIE